MKITKSQLRRIIRESLLLERKTIATVSDITRFRPQVEEWVEILIDDLPDISDRWNDVNEKRVKNMIQSITDAVVNALISATSGMSYSSEKRQKQRKEEESHEKWDKQRSARTGNFQYYGESMGYKNNKSIQKLIK